MTALWEQIAKEVKAQLATVTARIVPAGAASSGKIKLRIDPASATDSDELYAMLKGLPKIAAGDDLAVIKVGGKDFVLGAVQRSTQTAITYDLPIVAEKGANSPIGFLASQNSADVTSSTDTANYVTTLTTDLVLPTGTWTIRAISAQMLSHSSSGGAVRAQTRIGATTGTSLSAAVPLDNIRATLVTQTIVTGQAGTVACVAQYRPNTTGTAYSGGGTLSIFGWRTA